jgi:Arc/MetJ family transcription regulator
MPTNLNVDDDLLAEAQRLGGKRTKRETVNEALAEYIRRRRQQRVLELFHKLDWDPEYDYKRERART